MVEKDNILVDVVIRGPFRESADEVYLGIKQHAEGNHGRVLTFSSLNILRCFQRRMVLAFRAGWNAELFAEAAFELFNNKKALTEVSVCRTTREDLEMEWMSRNALCAAAGQNVIKG